MRRARLRHDYRHKSATRRRRRSASRTPIAHSASPPMFQGAPALRERFRPVPGLLLRAAPPTVQDHPPLVRVRAPPRLTRDIDRRPMAGPLRARKTRRASAAGSAPPSKPPRRRRRRRCCRRACRRRRRRRRRWRQRGPPTAVPAPATALKARGQIALRRAGGRCVGDQLPSTLRRRTRATSPPGVLQLQRRLRSVLPRPQATRRRWVPEAGCCCALCAADPSCVAWQVLFKDDCGHCGRSTARSATAR